MDASRKALKAIVDLQKEAKQEAIGAFGRELLQLLAKHGFQAIVEPTARTTESDANQPAHGTSKVSEPPPETDAGRVLQAIRSHSGLQSAELKRVADGKGKEIKNKTFKTSLYRLKVKGHIRQSADGRWYAAGAKTSSAA